MCSTVNSNCYEKGTALCCVATLTVAEVGTAGCVAQKDPFSETINSIRQLELLALQGTYCAFGYFPSLLSCNASKPYP